MINVHGNLIQNIILAVQRKYDNARLFKYQVGLFKTIDNRPVSIGIKGHPDIAGHIGPYVLYIEAKTGSGRLTKEQKAFKKNV